MNLTAILSHKRHLLLQSRHPITHVALTFTKPPWHAMFTTKLASWKRANHGWTIITVSFFTVANRKWRSIELYQISHFSVKQSEIWVRDYFAVTRSPNILLDARWPPLFFRQITSFSDSFHYTKKQKNLCVGSFNYFSYTIQIGSNWYMDKVAFFKTNSTWINDMCR